MKFINKASSSLYAKQTETFKFNFKIVKWNVLAFGFQNITIDLLGERCAGCINSC